MLNSENALLQNRILPVMARKHASLPLILAHMAYVLAEGTFQEQGAIRYRIG